MRSRLPVGWELLTPALGRLAVGAAAAAILFGASDYHAVSSRERQARQEARLHEARSTHRRLREARETLQRLSGRYRDGRERGVIGAERRLQWIETLQDTAASLRLPEVNYTLSPRTAAPELSSEATVYRSEMTLSMTLLHEGDLLDLTAGLDRGAHGLFRVRECQLARGDGTHKLTARCRLEWFTVGAGLPAEDNTDG